MSEQGGRGAEKGLSRREFVKRAGVAAGGLVVSGAAAQPIWARPRSFDADQTLKIGWISPLTGPAAGFGEGDPWVIKQARNALQKGVTIGGKQYQVQIVTKDGQSNPTRAAQVANELIHSDNVDILLVTSTPEQTNPAADAAEAAGVPNVATVCPWESWYFGRGAKPGQPSPFRYGAIFCFGTHEFFEAYSHLWPQVKTNKKVGVMWPNDADGNAIRENLGPLLEKKGYTIVDPGGYQDGTNDYSSQIAKFKAAKVQIFNTFPIPPDFVTFWRQAKQQGLTRQIRIAQIAKTGLFPSQVQAVGKLGPGLASAAYWTPHYPYKSSLTGMSSKQIGDGYTKATGRQWNQQLGSSAALLDVGVAALKASGDPKNKTAVAQALMKLKVETPNGILHWGAGGAKNPFPNVVATPIIGGQWVRAKGKFPLDFVLCEHSTDPRVKIQAKLQPYHGEVAEGTTLLEAVGVRKRFGALVVLDGVDFAVGADEEVGIVGPNGAGKTTLLNVLAGAYRPDGGRVLLRGQDVTRATAARRCRVGIGRAHQVPRPFGGMTVFENVLVGAGFGTRRRRREAYRTAVEVLELCALGDVANRRAESLGLLHRKRLELARALATDPAVLLLDEIGAGLTDAEAAELVVTIGELRRRGIAIVWIEHIVHVLVQVVERLVAMDGGRVIADGAPSEVMRDAAVVDAYLGSAAV